MGAESESRCPRCAVQRAHCLCAYLEPPIETDARIVIVRHARERHRPTNTAQIAAQALSRAVLLDYGAEGSEALDLSAWADGAWLLYPAGEGDVVVAAGAPPPRTLVVLDGTWSQTQRLVRRHAALARMPRCALRPPPRPWRTPRLRHSDDPSRLLTMEAIASYLALHEYGDRGPRLMELHRRFVAATLAGRGTGVPDGWIDTGATW